MKLSYLRKLNKESQQQLADAIGVKRYTIADWEQGRSEPSIKYLLLISKHFKITVDFLLTD